MLFWLVIVLLFSVLFVVQGQILLGITHGYVFNSTGGFIVNATVSVVVNGCSGVGCSGTGTTDSGGYYLIANLNLPAGGTVNVSANKSFARGNSTGIADGFQVAEVNVTMTTVPSAPSLVPVNDSHNQSFFLLNWTSGIDPDSLPTYDQLQFDSESTQNATAPQNRTNLDFASYTWQVRTCNAFACSDFASDTFLVYNNPPPAPILQDQNNTVSNAVQLNWTSGGADPDGDPTHFNFRIDSQALQINVTPIYNVSNLSFGNHTWKVQECDPYECSAFSTDVFEVINNAPSPPTLIDQGDTYDDSVTLTWTSGIDPDGDSTYDDYDFNGTTYITNATSPQTESLTGVIDYFYWRVRTCDIYDACSEYVSDTFIHYLCV